MGTSTSLSSVMPQAGVVSAGSVFIAGLSGCGCHIQSGSSTFTSSVTFFQYASSALFQVCGSSNDALGTALNICCLKAVVTCSEPSACTAAWRTTSSTSRGVAAGAYSADHRPLEFE